MVLTGAGAYAEHQRKNIHDREWQMDIKNLARQFRGRKLGELVMHHYANQSATDAMNALAGTTLLLPKDAQTKMADWVDEVSPIGADPQFWRADCGEAFERLTEFAISYFRDEGINIGEEDALNLFQILILNFTYTAHKNPSSKAFIQKSIGVGFLGRLFG